MSRSDRFALNVSTNRRNYLLATAHGVCVRLGMNLADPSLVLSVFVRILGGSNTLVGLLPAIRFGGWFLPQFLAASWIQPQARKVPIAVALETVRVSVYGAFAVLTYALGLSYPSLLLVIFFVLFTISRLTTGTGALARMDTIGKVILPPQRGSFFATRNFWGGVLVFGAGLLIRYMLDPTHGQPFPLSFTLLFAFSCGCFRTTRLTTGLLIHRRIFARRQQRECSRYWGYGAFAGHLS